MIIFRSIHFVANGIISLSFYGRVVFYMYIWASQVTLVVNNLPANAGDRGDWGSIPGLGRSPEGELGNPLQYSCLENPHGQNLVGYSP